MTTLVDAARRPTWAGRARRAAAIVAWLAAVVAIACGGWLARDWTWRATVPIRFHGDVENALHLGREVNRDAVERMPPERRGPTTVPAWPDVWQAYRATYDRAYAAGQASLARDPPAAGKSTEIRYPLDYPPGRLAIATLWVHHLRADFAAGRGPEPGAYVDALVAPMLGVNAVAESLAAIGAFALTRRVLRDANRPRWRATWAATLAAGALWLSPALILDAHGWPQWDAWALPFTIWATYCATRGRWLGVGALLAAGAMFKGQVLLVAPLFVAWPLARGEVGPFLRLAAGFVACGALCVSPSLIQTVESTRWMIGVAIAVGTMVAVARWHRHSCLCRAVRRSKSFGLRPNTGRNACATELVVALCAFAWIVAPFVIPGQRALLPLVIALGVATVALPLVWRRPVAIALLVLGVATFAGGARFGGSYAWLHVGFQTERYPSLANGRVSNLPAILAGAWQWRMDAPVPIGTTMKIECRSLLRAGVYLVLLVLSIAAGRASRRGEPNLLLALPAAWLAIYALMPQMHERYLVWAAATSAFACPRSFGGALACVALNAISTAMILASMLDNARAVADAPAWRPWYRAIGGVQPNIGYAIVTLMVTLVVWACAMSPLPRTRGRGLG